MPRFELEQQWQELASEVLTGFRAWRAQHPTATLSEIEEALDAAGRWRGRGWSRMRRCAARPPTGTRREARPVSGLRRADAVRWTEVRRLTTAGEQTLTLTARAPAARPAGPGFSPLDEELGLVPGVLTPRLQEGLCAWAPGCPCPGGADAGLLHGGAVSAATARRQTERPGRPRCGAKRPRSRGWSGRRRTRARTGRAAAERGRGDGALGRRHVGRGQDCWPSARSPAPGEARTVATCRISAAAPTMPRSPAWRW